MRRIAFAAAVCGTMLLAACSDQPQAPTEPAVLAPDATFGTCQPVRFPILNVSRLIDQVFKGRTRNEALLRAAAVAVLWDTCHEAAAQKVAVNFVNWIDLNAPKNAPASKVLELKIAVLNGVGIPVDAPPAGFPDDFGAGTFDPSNPNKTVIKTKSGRALIELEPGSFLEPTVITISRKADNFDLSDFDGREFPPAYDYDATNASGNHVLQTGKTAIVAFCLLALDDAEFPGGEGFPPGYPEHPRIGHNPVLGAPGFPFEVLDEVNLVAEGLRDDLQCPEGTLPDPVIGSSAIGPSEFANAAWRMVGRYLGPIILPRPLLAATTLATLPPPPPIGGKARSLSPFKVVEATVTTSTSLTSSSLLGIVGEGPTLTATVSPAPSTTQEGEVEFFDGTTSLGSAFLNSDGVAVFTASSLSLDQHSLTAQFLGTPTHAASTSSALVQNMVERFAQSAFADAVGGAAGYSTQNFDEGFDDVTPVSTIIDGVLTVTSPFDQLLVSGTDLFLFGSDIEGNPTRTAGDGQYDLAFTAPLTKNALAFDVMAEDPSAGPATVVVSVGAASATFSVPNTSGNETTPVFFGVIASAPISSVEVIEGPETPTIISEEIGLDNFQVGTVSLPFPVILLR